jgi:hypothetical protein
VQSARKALRLRCPMGSPSRSRHGECRLLRKAQPQVGPAQRVAEAEPMAAMRYEGGHSSRYKAHESGMSPAMQTVEGERRTGMGSGRTYCHMQGSENPTDRLQAEGSSSEASAERTARKRRHGLRRQLAEADRSRPDRMYGLARRRRSRARSYRRRSDFRKPQESPVHCAKDARSAAEPITRAQPARKGVFRGIENRASADSDEGRSDKFLRRIAIFPLTGFFLIHKIWIDY